MRQQLQSEETQVVAKTLISAPEKVEREPEQDEHVAVTTIPKQEIAKQEIAKQQIDEQQIDEQQIDEQQIDEQRIANQQVELLATDAEMEEALCRLRQQASLYTWLSGIAVVIFSMTISALILGIGVYGIMQDLMNLPVVIHFNADLYSFGVIGQGVGNQGTEITFSGLLPLLIMVLCGFTGAFVQRKRIALVYTVARFDDLRAVGPLIQALYIRDKALRSEVVATLTRLIPRMREEDALRLESSQRLLLNYYIGRSRYARFDNDKSLSLAILRAYPVIGDGTELGFVRRIAQGRGEVGREASAREAAQEYLDIVERRKAEATERTSLLRGSSASELGSDTLLRAGQSNAETAPDTLLRPSETSSE